jgi:5-(aminomethyl)-3-furanmethanol phosphate kinase
MIGVNSDMIPDRSGPPDHPLLVVKVGGGLLARKGSLDEVGQALALTAKHRALVVIPGGGPFADLVREFDRHHGLSPSAAHWMAILGMDQYAYAIADHTPGARVVHDLAGIQLAHRKGALPVLAPHRWLSAADELPHTWEVTSDSLAAYLATLIGAEELVLVKPAEGGEGLVDSCFRRTLPAGIRWRVVGATAEALQGLIG